MSWTSVVRVCRDGTDINFQTYAADFCKEEIRNIDYIDWNYDHIPSSQNIKPGVCSYGAPSKVAFPMGDSGTYERYGIIDIEVVHFYSTTKAKIEAIVNHTSLYFFLFPCYNSEVYYSDKTYYHSIFEPNYVETYVWGQAIANVITKLRFYTYSSQTVA